MKRLITTIFAILVIPTLAFAVVQPSKEMLQKDPTLKQRYLQMLPQLQNWEFKQQPKQAGPGTQSYDIITHNLGKTVADYAKSNGLDPDSADVKLQDLNFDGRIDQFDLLELGYEARPSVKHTSTAPTKGTNKILIFRSDFSDQNANYGTFNVAYFNNEYFNANASPYPSFHDFYWGTSYHQLDIEGTVENHGPGGDGWYKGSQTRNYYRDQSGGDRLLIAEAVQAADPDIDFSQYDVDHDGYVDCFMIFYPGVEFSGNLWPHRSSGLNIHVDGVIIDAYFISGVDGNANDMTIACHEYGHILGLPDLYDVDYSSGGMARWSLMSYQYDGTQHCPSPDPWSKIQLGWLQPENIMHNVTGKQLPDYEDNPKVLRVWPNGKEEDQYFLLANYKLTGTDSTRPGDGLLIEHIDETKSGNDQDNAQEYRKHVDVVSARGWEENAGTATALDWIDKQSASGGDTNDLWKSGNQTTFNDASSCDSLKNNYPSAPTATGVAVTNISAPQDTMTMDITVDTANKPSCTITAPNDGDTVTGNQTITATATAVNPRTITSVDFYCNGAYLGQDTTSPYSWTFDSRSIYNGSGNRVIRAVATDSSGDIDSDDVTVTVSNAASSYPFNDAFTGDIGQWAGYHFAGAPVSGNYRRFTYFGSVGGQSGVAGIGSTSNGYGYSEHDQLVSRRIDLTGTSAPLARWKQRFRVVNGENQVNVYVTADEGVTFDKLYTGTGSTGGGSTPIWLPHAIDLSPYIGQQIRLVFELSGSTLSRQGGDGGLWVDDFYLKDASQPPQVISITPDEGSDVTGNQTITVNATDDEGVAAVQFWVDGNDLIGTDTTSPYSLNWNSDWVFDGTHTLTATALDDDQLSGSATVHWNVSNPGTAVPWAEPWTANTHYADGTWRIFDNGGSATWFWGSGLGQSGGGMKFGKSSGNYDDGENDDFLSPTLNLSSLPDPSISFLHHYDFETGYDFAKLFVTTDLNTWTQLGSWSQTGQSAWRADGYRLDSYAGQKIKLDWHAESDTGVTATGWWVDDFNLRSAPQITDVSPNRIQRGQTPSVTVTGTGFGPDPSANAIEGSNIKLGATTLSPTAWSDTSITFDLPAGVASANLVVHRRGIDSDGYWLQIVLGSPTLGGLGQE